MGPLREDKLQLQGRPAFEGDRGSATGRWTPGVRALVKAAAWTLPLDIRETHRAEWESDLLAALHDDTERYPVTRFLKSVSLAVLLVVRVSLIRRELAVGRGGLLMAGLSRHRGYSYAAVFGAAGAVTIAFALAGTTAPPSPSIAQQPMTAQSIATWAYDKVGLNSYRADNVGNKTLRVSWTTDADGLESVGACSSSVRIQGRNTDHAISGSGCSDPIGTCMSVQHPGEYVITVTAHTDSGIDRSHSIPVTIIP